MKDQIIEWIRSMVGDASVVIGISGGKDSSVVAALCVAALGKDRVYGVMMPDGVQHDIDVSRRVIEFLGIHSFEINIHDMVQASFDGMRKAFGREITYQTKSNLPARIRMATLYNVAAMIGNCRVANTCNFSEDYIGYSTKYGDSAGDFAPIQSLFVSEVRAVGRELGLPREFVEKVPEDGLSGKTDEENFGFSYDAIEEYYLHGTGKPEVIEKIKAMHRASLHKVTVMPRFMIEGREWTK